MKNIILTLVALIAVALSLSTTASADNCRVNSSRVQNRSHQQRNNVNVVRLGSRVLVLNDFDNDHRIQNSRVFNGRAFNNRVLNSRAFNHDNEVIVSTFINGDGDKVGVTNFGNEFIIQRNARLVDSRFFGFNSRRVGGFNNNRVSSIAERAIDRTADVLLFNAFLNSRGR